MKINWKVRVKNKNFWMSLIPALAMVAMTVLAVFNIEVDLNDMTEKALKVVAAVFSVLTILGVVVDPTTAGIGDSDRALGYLEPWDDDKKEEE